MEALSNGVEDYLIDGLSFKLPSGSSYVTDRRKVTYWASGSNIYTPLNGTKVIRFVINGEDGTWLDPNTVRVNFDVKSLGIANLRPFGSPALFFRRLRVLVGNQVAEDILDYGRVNEMFFSLMSDNVRDNMDCEGFGYRYDDWQIRSADNDDKYNLDNIPGITAGHSHNVSLKLLSGLLGGQDKFIPIKFAPITIELELVGNHEEAVISPGKKKPHSNENSDFEFANTTTNWQIENVCVKCDVCTLDNSLNNSYVEHLLSGKALPLKYSTFISQQSAVTNGSKNMAVQVSRAVSRLQKCFVTFFRIPGTGEPETILDKQGIQFYHPMCNTINPTTGKGHYDQDWEMEFQIQLGPKLYPEYPVKSIAECFSHLKQALNLPDWGLHSIGIDFKHYISSKFIFGISFEKVPQASWTGVSTKAGELLIVKCNATGSSINTINLPTMMFITLQSENILEIRDVGISIYD